MEAIIGECIGTTIGSRANAVRVCTDTSPTDLDRVRMGCKLSVYSRQ